MPFINLIEEQRQAMQRAARKTRIAFFGFAFCLFAPLLGFASLLFLTESLGADIVSLKNEVNKLEPMNSQILTNQKMLSQLTPRLTSLGDAQKTTARWSRILEHLTVNTPFTMWLTQVRSMTGGDPEKPVVTSFQGMCDRLEPVGEFILRLQASTDLEAVNLKFANEKIVTEGRGIEFEISASIVGTAEEQPKKKTGKEGASA